jgi:hypothetical protein
MSITSLLLIKGLSGWFLFEAQSVTVLATIPAQKR